MSSFLSCWLFPLASSSPLVAVHMSIDPNLLPVPSLESGHFMPNGTMMFQPANGHAFPTYLNEAAHFYSPEALYHFALAAGHHPGNAGPGPGPGPGAINQTANSASNSAHTYHHPALMSMYQQQPFYIAQPQSSPNAAYPSHFQATPQPHHGAHATIAGGHWPQYMMPQVMVNSHLNHVS